MAEDILSQLRGCSWTVDQVTVSFPVTEMKMSFSHDQKQHKFWRVDGARIENNGRNPLMFKARIPFSNHVSPGKNESFTTGDLYPNAFRAFVNTTAVGTTGTLIHPEFGPVQCKVEGEVDINWSPNLRDGATVDVTWIETRDDDSASALINVSPVQGVQTRAADLDRQLAQTVLPQDPVFTPSFEDQMNSIAGIADQISLQSQRVVGKIDEIGYRLNKIDTAINNIAIPPRTSVKSIINPDPAAANKALSVLYWPIRATVNNMQNGLTDLKQKILESGKTIVLYRVPRTSTLALVSITTKANLKDLMNLNPDLVRAPYISTGTTVRYYSSAA